jgi:cytochrome c biogenesis protein CcmG, thiol:disulfide interchange protein DsbE
MAARFKLTGQLLAVALVAGLLALLVWKLVNGSGKTAEPQNFNLPRLDRPGKLELASLRGKVVVLNFMASWCGPCGQEAPAIEKVWNEYRAKGVVVVGVDTADDASDARAFVRSHGLTYPIVRSTGYSIWGPYGLSGVPETRVIDRNGRYGSTQFYGAVSGPDLDRAVAQALSA